MTNLKTWLQSFRKEEGQETLLTPIYAHENFILTYKSLKVGTLSVSEGIWKFEYSDDFKKQNTIRPLWDFSDIDKIYRFDYMPPFFSQRIPSLEQPKVKEILKKEHIDVQNDVALLKRFGHATISNPFILHAI